MGEHPGPYDGMTDTDLIGRAKELQVLAFEAPDGSDLRAEKLAAHEAVMTELKLRLLWYAHGRLGLQRAHIPAAAVRAWRLELPDINL
jgi:hypothetical protein